MTIQVNAIPASLSKDRKQSGLSDKCLGVIAYITIVPAIILLTVSPSKKSSYVRLQAWQSVLLNVAAYIITAALGITLSYYGPYFYLSLRLFFWVVCCFVWRQCVVRALEGKHCRLTFIGDLAELLQAGTGPSRAANLPQHSQWTASTSKSMRQA